KADTEDILVRLNITNRGPEQAPLAVLPTIWFRNTWSWAPTGVRPSVQGVEASHLAIVLDTPKYGRRYLHGDGAPELLITDNETNTTRLFGFDGPRYTKDAFHRYVVDGETRAINPEQRGTKAAALYRLVVAAGETVT